MSKQTEESSGKSVKSSSRSATGVKHITGISKLISGNKENSSKTEEKIKATQERAKGSSQTGAMALKKALEGEKGGKGLISSSETSSESVAASNELKTAQKIQTVSRQTRVLKSSSTMESNATSEYLSKNISKACLGETSKTCGGRTTMVVTLHPNLGEQHRLCSFKEKKVFSSFSPFDSLLLSGRMKAFCIS